MSSFAKGDRVNVKGNTYGCFEFIQVLPKGSHGRKCALAEVLHSSTLDFSFSLVKVFRLIDLRKVV